VSMLPSRGQRYRFISCRSKGRSAVGRGLYRAAGERRAEVPDWESAGGGWVARNHKVAGSITALPKIMLE